MKLLFIGGGFEFWGVEQALLTLETSLSERGVRCAHVTSGWSNGVFARKLRAAGVAVFPIKLGRLYLTRPRWTLDTLKEFPRAAVSLRRLVKSFAPDAVVHLDTRLFPISYLILSDFRGAHIYNESVTPSPSKKDAVAYRAIFSRTSLVIANSKDSVSTFKELGYDVSRVKIVENGIDLKTLHPSSHERSGPVRIGIVGQVIPRKGHDILIEAVGLLQQRRLDFRVVIVGSGDKEFTNIVKSKAADCQLDGLVCWAGVIDEKAAIYNLIDILTVPSRSEAFGLVAIEAAAACLPVVASRIGGLPDVISDGVTGILVAPENASELADALEHLIINPELRKALGEAGRQRVEARFGADRWAEDYRRAVEAVL